MKMKKVMVVEDEPTVLLVIKRVLSEEFDVAMAGGGEEALKLCEKDMPSLIVLDIMMPKMDGWEFLERFRGLTGAEKVPVIILSARSQVSDVLSGSAVNGIVDYITKPFDNEELRNRVREAIGNGR